MEAYIIMQSRSSALVLQLTWHKDLGQKNKLLTGLALRYNLYDDNTPATVIANEWWLPSFLYKTN